MTNIMGAAEFKARCLRVISQMNKDRQAGDDHQAGAAGGGAVSLAASR